MKPVSDRILFPILALLVCTWLLLVSNAQDKVIAQQAAEIRAQAQTKSDVAGEISALSALLEANRKLTLDKDELACDGPDLFTPQTLDPRLKSLAGVFIKGDKILGWRYDGKDHWVEDVR